MGGGGGAMIMFLIGYSLWGSGGMPPLPPEIVWYFCALRQLLVQSEAKI